MSTVERFSALVIAVKGNVATVRVGRPAAGCGRCGEPGGCGGGLGSTGVGRPIELQVSNALNSSAGDRVIISMPKPSLVGVILPGYGGAALLVIAGAVAGKVLAGTDLASITGALLTLWPAICLFRWCGRQLQLPTMESSCLESPAVVQPCHSQEAI